MTTKEKLTNAIEESASKVEYLKNLRSDCASFKMWRQKTAATIEQLFGRDSRAERDFDNICKELTSQALPEVANWYHAQDFLENLLSEIPESTSVNKKDVEQNGNKIFIVHGHDDVAKWELKNFLNSLSLDVVILHEQDDLGKTIIEKFEYYANECRFAFILFTPDDAIHHSSNVENKWRARQNVIMELGWFMASLGRKNVVIIHKGEVEIPSDILGVIYLKFNSTVMEVSERIRQRLKGANLI